MDYTKENGEFYKILDKEIIYRRLTGDDVLSTIHDVVLITKEEYTAATGIEVVEIPETELPDYFGAAPENQPEVTEE